MKTLIKIYLITGIALGLLVMAKVFVEFYETRLRKYIQVDAT